MLKWEDIPSDLQELIMTSTQRGIDKKQEGIDFGVSIADDVMLCILKDLCRNGTDTSQGECIDLYYYVKLYLWQVKNCDDTIIIDDVVLGVLQVFKDVYHVKGFGVRVACNYKTMEFNIDDIVSVMKGGCNKPKTETKHCWKWWSGE